MTNGQAGGLVGFALTLAIGQTLFKIAAQNAAAHAAPRAAIMSMLQGPSFWAALLLYGFATLWWIYLLQFVPLSRAYPFAALGFIIVPALAVVLFGEKVTPSYMAGAALIVAGVIITSRS